MVALYVVLGVIFAFFFGFVSSGVAERKGYSNGYFWLGFLLGPIGLLFVACLADIKIRETISNLSALVSKNSNIAICPNCKNVVVDIESCFFCPHCGSKSPSEWRLTNEEVWTCNKCSRINSISAKYCVQCGVKKNDEILITDDSKKTEENRTVETKSDAKQSKKEVKYNDDNVESSIKNDITSIEIFEKPYVGFVYEEQVFKLSNIKEVSLEKTIIKAKVFYHYYDKYIEIKCKDTVEAKRILKFLGEGLNSLTK